jgi:hypothetical protein
VTSELGIKGVSATCGASLTLESKDSSGYFLERPTQKWRSNVKCHIKSRLDACTLNFDDNQLVVPLSESQETCPTPMEERN